MNCIWLNNGDKVDQDTQTNDSTKHLEETAQENQVKTEQLRNYNCDASEKRSDVTKNNNEQKEPNKRKTKHPILPLCNCKRTCIEKIDEEQRNNIHSQYWNLDKELQKEYLFQRVESIPKKRERVRGCPKKQRKHSRVYSLKVPKGESVQVCSQFFLATLGFKKDNIITTLFKNEFSGRRLSISSIPDKRGKHDPHHKMSQSMKDKIIQHIESYDPTVIHYRRAHAPLRKYLPSEMHKDFIQSHSQEKVSYESYRKILNSMNISFTKLGEEQCELCEEHTHDQCQEKRDSNEQERENNNCEIRKRIEIHLE